MKNPRPSLRFYAVPGRRSTMAWGLCALLATPAFAQTPAAPATPASPEDKPNLAAPEDKPNLAAPEVKPNLAAGLPAEKPDLAAGLPAEKPDLAAGLPEMPAGTGTAATADPDVRPMGNIIERIIAVVDSDVVLLSEVDAAMDAVRQSEPPPQGADAALYFQRRRKEVVETLIADKLLEGQIRKLRIDVSEQEVTRALEATKAQYKLDDAALEMALAQQGVTPAEYRENLKKQLLKLKIIELKVKSRVQVTDQDIKSSVATKKAAAQEAYALRASHILFLVSDDGTTSNEANKRILADQAVERVRAGEPFADVAKAMSEGPSRTNGGALGTFGRGEMLPAFEQAAFAAKVGEVIGPVRTSVGWHVIIVKERVVSEVATGDDKTEMLRAQLYEEEMERAFRRYIDELKAAAYIEVRDDALANR